MSELSDAKKWKFVRDKLWKNLRRDDLPIKLTNYFYDVMDEKYPSAVDLDKALEYLIELEEHK